MPEHVALNRLDGFAFASRKFPEYMHFRQVRCKNCDVVFASPVPDSSWVRSAYRDASFDAGSESACAAMSYGEVVKQILPSLPETHGALDIGAGDGAFLMELKALGFVHVMGVEPSVEPVRSAAPEIAPMIRNEFFSADNFQRESLDLVTCFQTLEHVEDPLELCRSVHGLLVRGGAFVTVAHDFRAPLARLFGRKSPIYDIEHLQLFSRTSLERLLSTAGFADVSVYGLCNAYPLHYWLRLAPLPSMVKQFLCRRARSSILGQRLIRAKVGNLIAIGYRR